MTLRVLVVEDEFLIAEDLTELIEERNHIVLGTADSLESAIHLIKDRPPDVATIDLRLKYGQKGTDVAAYLLNEYGIHSIFVSGNLDKKVREALLWLEPIAFVGKPVSPHLLFRALDEAARQIGEVSSE